VPHTTQHCQPPPGTYCVMTYTPAPLDQKKKEQGCTRTPQLQFSGELILVSYACN
jgi:hypothetical protein